LIGELPDPPTEVGSGNLHDGPRGGLAVRNNR
jgi:hypothetical protein